MRSLVESRFLEKDTYRQSRAEHADIIVTDSSPELGKLVALRFLEVVQENPKAVVSLPTGRTPEYFIKWVRRFLSEWDTDEIIRIRDRFGLESTKPDMSGITFVQMDEFFPISPNEQRSFNYFIKNEYIPSFGFDPANCVLMDTSGIATIDDFPHGVDLTLLDADPATLSDHDSKSRDLLVRLQNYCTAYEKRIHDLGGLDFFLGGIGPDGHVAFNISGSDFDSTTRPLKLNYQSLAASAESLGGISVARRLAVITIGLGTIRKNPNCVTIIFAAGAAKAEILCRAIEYETSVSEPAHALRNMNSFAFYITKGATVSLRRSAHVTSITPEDIQRKVLRGAKSMQKLKFMHTEPHHDDIMLGYLPFILANRSAHENSDTFVCATSGFNSVSNSFLRPALATSKQLTTALDDDPVDLFCKSYPPIECLAMRLAKYCERGDIDKFIKQLDELKPGQVPSAEIRFIKGKCREFEAECLWRLQGWPVSRVYHLNLGFYTSDIFNPAPVFERDCAPILDLLLRIHPDVVTLALDPESSGPDTHYKVLQATTAALVEYEERTGRSPLIWGYRNVWYTFELEETDMIIPVTKQQAAETHELFMKCYQTQKKAEFPSALHDGPFSEIAIKTWEEQLEKVVKIVGPDVFKPDVTGLIFIRAMSISELRTYSRSIRFAPST